MNIGEEHNFRGFVLKRLVENVNEDRKIKMPCRYGKRVGIGLEGVKSENFEDGRNQGCVSWNKNSENRMEGKMDEDLKDMSR